MWPLTSTDTWSYTWSQSAYRGSMPASRKPRRSRGEVEQLPSGSYRVRVYAGIDPLSKKRHYLTETVPAGPGAATAAEKVRTRFLNEVDERRAPRTKATVSELLERYLDVLEIEDTTRNGYEQMVRLYIGPLLGAIPVGRMDGEVLDTFYSQLRRCRRRCSRRRGQVDHRVVGDHECNGRCRPHVCRPLGASYLRQMHSLLNGAFARAVKWRWLGVNPVEQADAPSQPPPDPHPTAEQAARIVEEAFKDPDWGMLVWTAMTTGARRGELCALRLDRHDVAGGVLDIRTSIAQINTRLWEKDTKTHQRRRIVLDDQTAALLAAYRAEAVRTAKVVGVDLRDADYLFSALPDHSEHLKPDTVTQRYSRMCARLGYDMHIHQLRHYSATELIAAGVDIRTVAGRLGHSGGGTTTLRVYSAWVAEADQRAAKSLTGRLQLPSSIAAPPDAPLLRPRSEPAGPYEQIANDLEGAIRLGALAPGDRLPTLKLIAERYDVSVGTAHRALTLLAERGFAELGGRGRPSTALLGA
ncbi:hypothetical protein GCM10009772_17780 [Pseudonocardia alni subsp. carboxydivorans]